MPTIMHSRLRVSIDSNIVHEIELLSWNQIIVGNSISFQTVPIHHFAVTQSEHPKRNTRFRYQQVWGRAETKNGASGSVNSGDSFKLHWNLIV